MTRSTRRPAKLTLLAQTVSIAGAIMAILALVDTSQGLRALLSLGTLWVISPFVLTMLVLAAKPISRGGVTALLLCSLFGLALFYNAFSPHGSSHSTGGLGFVFVPLWQLLGCLCAATYTLAVEAKK